MKDEPNQPATTVQNPCPGQHSEPVEGDPIWCPGDTTAIQAAIASLPAHCAALTPGPLNTGRDVDLGIHTLGVDTPSPSPSWDVIDTVIRWAIHTEDTLRAHQGHADRTKEPYRSLSASVTYLTAQSLALLASPQAETAGAHVLRLTNRLEKVTGTDRPLTHLPDPCPYCCTRGLVHADGSETVLCNYCGCTSSWEHYDLTHAYHTKTVAS